MAYTYTFAEPGGGASGSNGRIFPSPIMMSQVFDGNPQFYAGSSIEIQEILTVVSQVEIGKEYLVDVDLRWFQPKTYFGTYQLSGLITGLEDENAGGQGFITSDIQKFIRRSRYTVVANPDVPLAYEEIFTVDNCNFETAAVEVSFGGVTASYQRPTETQALFSGKVSKSRAPLADTEYNPFFKSIGLYYNPACTLVSIEQRVQVINVVSTDFGTYPDFSCSLLGG